MYKCQKCKKEFEKANTVKDELCGGTMQVCPFCNYRVYPRKTVLGTLADLFWRRS